MLRHHTVWIPSGELQRLAMEAGQTGKTCTRRLQELAEEKKLDVKYVKGHAHYKAASDALNAPPAKETLQDRYGRLEGENRAKIAFFDNYAKV